MRQRWINLQYTCRDRPDISDSTKLTVGVTSRRINSKESGINAIYKRRLAASSSSLFSPFRPPRAANAIYCFCRTPAYPARYIFSTLLLLGVVCHVNFARIARGWPSWAFNALPPSQRQAGVAFSASIRPSRCRRSEMQICPTPMKGLTQLPAINMLIVFESRDSGL